MIAIALATCNGERYLPALLDSLFAQTCQDWLLYISDDGSTDSTRAICEDCQAKHPDQVILLPGQRFGNARDNFFHLMAAAAGHPYLMCCDQDDIWLPDKVEKTLRLMQETEAGQPEIPCLVHTDLAVVDAELHPIADSLLRMEGLDPARCQLNRLLVQNVVTGCTMMLNAALLERVLRPAERQRIRMHDGWCALWAAATGRIAFLPEATVRYRQHEANQVGAQSAHLAALAGRGAHSRQALLDAEAQAAAFLTAADADLTPEQRRTVAAFAAIRRQRKMGRIRTLCREGLWMSGWQRCLGEILLI